MLWAGDFKSCLVSEIEWQLIHTAYKSIVDIVATVAIAVSGLSL